MLYIFFFVISTLYFGVRLDVHPAELKRQPCWDLYILSWVSHEPCVCKKYYNVQIYQRTSVDDYTYHNTILSADIISIPWTASERFLLCIDCILAGSYTSKHLMMSLRGSTYISEVLFQGKEIKWLVLHFQDCLISWSVSCCPRDFM